MRGPTGRFQVAVLLSCLVASGGAKSGPAAAAEPEPTPRPRLQGLPGPAGTGLLPMTPGGAAKSCGDLGLELERFLAEEVEPARQRLDWQRAYRPGAGVILVPTTTAGIGYVPGGPVVLGIAPPGGWDPGPVGAALLLGLTYFSERGRANQSGCEAFLDGRGQALLDLWESRCGGDDEPAPAGLQDAVEQGMTEIRSYMPCRGLFRPLEPPAAPLRPPEGPP